MFTAGVDLGPPDSSPFLCCPRHLHQACEICVDSGRGAPARPRGGSRASERTSVAQGGGISGFAEGAGVGGGLARPAFGGTLLRRSVPPVDEARMASGDAEAGAGGGNARLAELIPRFLRLSALVALELGREVGAEENGHSSGRIALAPTAQWYLLLAGLLTRALLEGYLTAGWTGLAPVQILLGVGLCSTATSDTTTMSLPPPAAVAAADDEYVEFEPDGMPDLTDAVDVLFPSRSTNTDAGGGVGYENSAGGGEGSGSGSGAARGGGESEYAREMGQRLARVCTSPSTARRVYPRLFRPPFALYAYALPSFVPSFLIGLLVVPRNGSQFLDVPASTPDLAMHMEDLAWQYPAEPVERAALRFCEALARWRGKPELETVRPHPRSPTHIHIPLFSLALTFSFLLCRI
jgi:hypothetical protein